jgi:histone H3/H4
MARKVAEDVGGCDIRFQDKALDGLQTASEAFLVEMLTEANKICSTSGRMTLQGNDLRLAISISGGESFEPISQVEEQEAAVDAYDSEQDEVAPTAEDADEEFSEMDEEPEEYEV